MEQNNVSKKERVLYLDYLRTIAIFMVLVVHACEIFYAGPDLNSVNIAPENAFWSNLIDSAMRACVPLFVITSGYLLLPIKETAGSFYKRRFTRILYPFVLWSVLYAILPYFFGQASMDEAQGYLVQLLSNFNMHSGHLWFIYMLIGIYLIMPILSPWLKTASKKYLQFFIGIWFITTFYHYAKMLVDTWYGECFWNEFHSFWYFSGFIGYIVLAVYMRKHINWSAKKNLLVGIPMFLLGYIVTYLLFDYQLANAANYYELEVPWRFCTPNVVFMTVGLFLIIKSIKIDHSKINKLFVELSKLSFGIYLVHMFLLWPLYENLVSPLGLSIPGEIVLTAVLTFLASALLTKLLSYLPKSKYIVG